MENLVWVVNAILAVAVIILLFVARSWLRKSREWERRWREEKEKWE